MSYIIVCTWQFQAPNSSIVHSPFTCQQEVYSLYIWVCFCFMNICISVVLNVLDFIISDVIWHLPFCFWLASLSLMTFRYINVAANWIISFFLRRHNISLSRAWQPTPVFFPRESLWAKEPDRVLYIGSRWIGHNWREQAWAMFQHMCVCVCIYIYIYIHTHTHHIFIHSSVNGHLGGFYILAIRNSATMNIGVYVSFQIIFLSGYMSWNGTAG